MTWQLALTIIFTTPFILAFALFVIVYLKELARESKILKEYRQGLTTLPVMVQFDKVQAQPKKAKPKEPEKNEPPKPDKKNVN